MEKGIYAAVFVVIAFSACVVHGCSKLEPGARDPSSAEEDNRKIYYTDYVVFGKIVENVTGNYPFKSKTGVMSVKFNVLCSYKGGDLPENIIIAGLGNQKEQVATCPPAPLEYGKDVVMFLKKANSKKYGDGVFEIEFKPNYGPIEIILDDLSINCGLSLTEQSAAECQDYIPLTKDEECEEYTPPTMAPTEPVEVTTEPQVITTKKEVVIVDNSDNTDDNDDNDDDDDEGYKTNVTPENKPNVKPDKTSGSSDPTGDASIPTMSRLACLSTILFTLLVAL